MVANGTALGGSVGIGTLTPTAAKLVVAATSSDKAIYATSVDGDVIQAYSTGGGSAISALGTDGNGVVAYSVNNSAAVLQIEPSSTNSIARIVGLDRFTSGLAANGIGASFDYQIETTAGGGQIATKLNSKWTDATDATRTSQFEIWGTNSAVTAVKFIVKGSGVINIPTALGDYADNAAAITAGLVAGDIYRNGDVMMVVH
jgi:hypothetical protein